ncbi:BPSS1780 family membrane protein [Leptothrix discophora]|uniref:BPSS1780 family membrane protein n=1 Tax=Leptothrix discophora TaxID=89 RepID=A0ABT9G2Y0_LEPDI|nr:BPSS1780 family membrane protein [Leptothrix discophora]MDP4300841.1 BPSS1780 family membrane protein [Leptothrix discophora]
MKLRNARARDGLAWTLDGLRWLKRQPLHLTGLFGVMLFSLALISRLPVIGAVLVTTLLPAMTAGWVHAVEQMRRHDAKATPGLLFAPLLQAGPNRITLLKVGLAHGLCILLLLALVDLLDPSFGQAWQDLSDASSEEAQGRAMEALQLGMLWRQVIVVPIALVFWHAPVLVHRDGMGLGKAIFGSALATLRNAGAFAVYGASWLAISALMVGVLALLGNPQLVLLIAVPLAMVMSAGFYASLHASVHGCIDLGDDEATPTDTTPR